MSKNNTLIISIVTIVLLIGVGAGYYFYQRNQSMSTSSQSSTNNTGGFNRAGGAGGNFANFTSVTGKIITAASNQITVEDDSGNQQIITISANTTIAKLTPSDATTVAKTDQYITASGAQSNGSLLATKVIASDAPATPNNPNSANANGGGQARGNRGNGANGASNGGNQGQANSNARNGARGKITNVTDSEIDVSGFNNSTQKVMIDANTKYFVQSKATNTDLAQDQTVEVMANTTGGVLTARTITID